MKRLTVFVAIGFLIALSFANVVFAKTGKGGQGGAFLRVPLGARANGLGNAFVAVANDGSASYWNPAGLVQIKERTFLGTYSLMSMDRKQYFASYVHAFGSFGTVGLMWSNFGVTDIEGRDAFGNATGSFDDTEMFFNIAYGKKVVQPIELGVGFKYLLHSLKDNKATGFVFDIGLLSQFNIPSEFLKKLSLGVSVSNIGGSLKWDTESSHEEDIPVTFRAGSALRFPGENFPFLISFEFDQTVDEDPTFHTGFEMWIYKYLGLRAGIDDGDLNFGTSFELFNADLRPQIDYAFCPDVLEEGSSHKISLGIRF